MKLIKISNLNFSIQLLGFISFLFLSSFLYSAPVFNNVNLKQDLSQTGPNDMVAIDLNADGNMDLVITEFEGADGTAAVEFFFGNGTGNSNGNAFSGNGTIRANPSGGDGLPFNPDGIAIGDVTGDGILDLAITSGLTPVDNTRVNNKKIYIYRGALTGTGNPKKYNVDVTNPIILTTFSVVHDVVIGDFNNDNLVDIVAIDDLGLNLFLGTAKGKFSEPAILFRTAGISYDIQAVVNKNGFLDIVTEHEIFFNNTPAVKKDITFISKAYYTGTSIPISVITAVTTGDFNGDLILDVAYALNYPQDGTTPPSSSMAVMLSSGSGMNVVYTKKETAKTLNSAITDIATADLDLDGIADVVTLDNSQDAMHIYTGFGDGSFALPTTSKITPAVGAPTRIRPKLLVITNIDNNQYPDIYTANDTNSNTPSLSVLLQQKGTENFVFGPNEYTVPIPAQVATPLSVQVLRKYPSATSTTINYTIVNGTAQSGTDFIPPSPPTNLIFATGKPRQSIPIEISANSNPVSSNFTIELKNSTNVVLDTATVALQSGVAAPTLSFFATNFNLYEDPTKSTTQITVIRSPSDTLSISNVDVISEDIINISGVLTATQIADYAKLTKTLTFASGVNSQSFTIPIVDDTLIEGDEKFRISLINEVNAQVLAPSAIVTIIDNDSAPVILPIATPDSASVVNSIGTVTIPVLDNDTPANAIDPKTVTIKLNPTKGTATADSITGLIIYKLTSKTDTGTDSFTYTVSDKNGKTTSPATVTITIIEAPVAGDDAESIVSNAVSKTFPVIGNDNAASPNSLIPGSVTIKTQGTKGKATVNAAGDVTYTLNSISETGTDSFTYTVGDSAGNSSLPATVTITIIDAPIAVNDDFFILNNEASKIFNILKNDTTVTPKKIDPASVVILKQPTKGNLILEANGSVTYELIPGSLGKDSFTYTVDDDDTISSPSEIATVTISILTPAQVKPGVFSFDSNNAYTVSEKTGKLVLNIIRESGSTGEVILTYLITDNSAKAGIDFNDNTVTSKPGTLTFADGVTNLPIILGIISDTEVEPDEDLSITLTSVTTGVIVAVDPKLVTITDSTVVTSPPANNPAPVASGGGGGCTLQAASRFDPILPLLFTLSLLYLGRRVRISRQL